MPQTINTEYRKTTNPYREYIGSCRPLIPLYRLTSTGMIQTVSNDPESRPFPSGPLFLSPTGQQEQSKILRSGYHYYNDGSAIETCSGVPNVYTIRTHSRGIRNFLLNPPYQADTDWATDIRNKVKSDMVNLASNLAEYRESADMFKDFARSLHSAYRSIRKGRLPKKFRGKRYWVARGKKMRDSNFSLGDLGTAELLASFGIVPLASDVARSVLALQKRFDFPIYKRLVITSSDKVDDSVSDYAWTTEYDWNISDRVILYIKVNPDDRRITVGNLGEWLWEATPFSFIADWGFNVGQYLSSLDALRGIDFMTGTKTRKIYGEARAFRHSPSSTMTWKKDCTQIIRKHSRAVITSVPLPRAPRWKPSPSFRKLAHATSLLGVMKKDSLRIDRLISKRV